MGHKKKFVQVVCQQCRYTTIGFENKLIIPVTTINFKFVIPNQYHVYVLYNNCFCKQNKMNYFWSCDFQTALKSGL